MEENKLSNINKFLEEFNKALYDLNHNYVYAFEYSVISDIATLIDRFKLEYPDEYNNLIWTMESAYVDYTYNEKILKIKYRREQFETVSTFNFNGLKDVVVYNLGVLKEYDGKIYTSIKYIIESMATTIKQRLSQMKCAIEYREKEKENKNKVTRNDLIKMLLENTTGKYGSNYYTNYLRNTYYRIINIIKDNKLYPEKDVITIDFWDIINHDLVKDYIFGQTQNPDHIDIFLEKDYYKDIKIMDRNGMILYNVENIDKMNDSDTEDYDKTLLKNIIINLLLLLIEDVEE